MQTQNYSPVVEDVLRKLAGSLKRLQRTLGEENSNSTDHADTREGRQDQVHS